MVHRPRIGPLLAGLVLIGLGMIFFLENWYGYVPFWNLFARYWPVLLILVGLKKLYNHFTWEEGQALPEAKAKE